MTIENRAHGAPRDGHKQTDKETEEVVKHGKESRDCGVEVRDGAEDGAEVSGAGTVAQRTEKGRPVADPGGCIWRGVEVVERQIQESPGLEAKTLFAWLLREYPGRFSD